MKNFRLTMKSGLFILPVIAAFILSVSSCKKYEQDPGISLHSKKSLVAGEWAIEKYIDDDGADKTDKWHSVYASETFKFTKDKAYEGTFNYTQSQGGGSKIETGTWRLEDKKSILSWSAPLILLDGGIGSQTSSDGRFPFKILKLTKEEMWIRAEDGLEEYHLKSK